MNFPRKTYHHFPVPSVPMIISGGQTGADRAALDWAISHRIPHEGWCPRGRVAEDGVIPPQYLLRETPSSDYSERTEWNVRDSDGTVIFSIIPNLSGGSQYTAEIARRRLKPCLHLVSQSGEPHVQMLRNFVIQHAIKRLNIAGPRDSLEKGIGNFVQRILEATFFASRDEGIVTSSKY